MRHVYPALVLVLLAALPACQDESDGPCGPYGGPHVVEFAVTGRYATHPECPGTHSWTTSNGSTPDPACTVTFGPSSARACREIAQWECNGVRYYALVDWTGEIGEGYGQVSIPGDPADPEDHGCASGYEVTVMPAE